MYCGPMSLKHVHESHGKRIGVRRAAKLCNTTRKGTYAADLIIAFQELGYSARVKENMKWSELKRYVSKGYDVIVTWWSILDSGGTPSVPDGHWCPVKSVTDDTITLWDPDPEEELTLPRKMFESLWWDYERDHAGRKDFIRAAVIAKYKG